MTVLVDEAQVVMEVPTGVFEPDKTVFLILRVDEAKHCISAQIDFHRIIGN